MTKFYNISFNTDGFMSKRKLSKECIPEMIYIHLYVRIFCISIWSTKNIIL